MKITAVIPARYNSTRFPGKPLADIFGKPMIQHVYERTLEVSCIDRVIVATDDQRICETVKSFNGEVILTSEAIKTGTDRIADAASSIDTDIVVNVQGDEPLIEPAMIEQVAVPFLLHKAVKISSLYAELKDDDDIENPNIVKVVVDKNQHALYFSRTAIPYVAGVKKGSESVIYKHIGIYGYTKEFLNEFVAMHRTPLEKAEDLEQLRALENGISISMVKTDYSTIGVDTKHDLDRVKRILEQKKSKREEALL